LTATSKSRRARALRVTTYRSGLEDKIAAQLASVGIAVTFEDFKISYVKPAKQHTYTPDFWLPNGIVIESKGRFLTEDRQKHKYVAEQHPDLDLRFVFSNSKTTISKASDTSYGMWCQRYGFKFADRLIPTAWFDEPVNHASLQIINSLRSAKKPRAK
jgi:hypothetical protein